MNFRQQLIGGGSLSPRQRLAIAEYIERLEKERRSPAASAAEPDETGPLSVDEREALVDWITRHRAEAGAAWASRLLAAYDAVYDAVATRPEPARSGAGMHDDEWSNEYWTLDQAIMDAAVADRPSSFVETLRYLRDNVHLIPTRASLASPAASLGEPAERPTLTENIVYTKIESSSARVSEDAPGDENVRGAVGSSHPSRAGCPMCGAASEIVTENAEATWGGARDGEEGITVTIRDTYHRCPKCGEEWLTAKQANRHFSALTKTCIEKQRAELTALRADRDRLGEELEKERARNCSECGDRLSRSHLCYSCLFDRLRSLKESLSSSPSSATLEKP